MKNKIKKDGTILLSSLFITIFFTLLSLFWIYEKHSSSSVIFLIAAIFLEILLWHFWSHKRPHANGPQSLIGSIVEVVEPLDPKGIVKLHGEIWSARSLDGPILKEEKATVAEVEKTVLVVIPNQRNGA